KPDLTRAVMAAGNPRPLESTVNRPGAAAEIRVFTAETVPFPLGIVTVAAPKAVPPGILKLACVGGTQNSGMSRSAPVLAFTLTVVPASVVGSGLARAGSELVANPVPNAATIDSTASVAPR